MNLQIGNTFVYILEMKKLWPKEVKKLSQNFTESMWETRIWTWNLHLTSLGSVSSIKSGK